MLTLSAVSAWRTSSSVVPRYRRRCAALVRFQASRSASALERGQRGAEQPSVVAELRQHDRHVARAGQDLPSGDLGRPRHVLARRAPAAIPPPITTIAGSTRFTTLPIARPTYRALRRAARIATASAVRHRCARSRLVSARRSPRRISVSNGGLAARDVLHDVTTDRVTRGHRLEAPGPTTPAPRTAGGHDHVADLARAAVVAVVQLTVDDQSAANARADEDRQHRAGATTRAMPVLAERCRAHVVFEHHRLARQATFELFPYGQIDPAQVWRPGHDERESVQGTRHADADGLDHRERQAGLVRGRCRRLRPADRGARPGVPQLAAREPHARSDAAIGLDHARQCLGTAQVDRDDWRSRTGGSESHVQSPRHRVMAASPTANRSRPAPAPSETGPPGAGRCPRDRRPPNAARPRHAALEVGDERQVLLIAQEHDRARTVERVDVRVEQARTVDRLQVVPGRVPGIGGMDR